MDKPMKPTSGLKNIERMKTNKKSVFGFNYDKELVEPIKSALVLKDIGRMNTPRKSVSGLNDDAKLVEPINSTKGLKDGGQMNTPRKSVSFFNDDEKLEEPMKSTLDLTNCGRMKTKKKSVSGFNYEGELDKPVKSILDQKEVEQMKTPWISVACSNDDGQLDDPMMSGLGMKDDGRNKKLRKSVSGFNDGDLDEPMKLTLCSKENDKKNPDRKGLLEKDKTSKSVICRQGENKKDEHWKSKFSSKDNGQINPDIKSNGWPTKDKNSKSEVCREVDYKMDESMKSTLCSKDSGKIDLGKMQKGWLTKDKKPKLKVFTEDDKDTDEPVKSILCSKDNELLNPAITTKEWQTKDKNSKSKLCTDNDYRMDESMKSSLCSNDSGKINSDKTHKKIKKPLSEICIEDDERRDVAMKSNLPAKSNIYIKEGGQIEKTLRSTLFMKKDGQINTNRKMVTGTFKNTSQSSVGTTKDLFITPAQLLPTLWSSIEFKVVVKTPEDTLEYKPQVEIPIEKYQFIVEENSSLKKKFEKEISGGAKIETGYGSLKVICTANRNMTLESIKTEAKDALKSLADDVLSLEIPIDGNNHLVVQTCLDMLEAEKTSRATLLIDNTKLFVVGFRPECDLLYTALEEHGLNVASGKCDDRYEATKTDIRFKAEVKRSTSETNHNPLATTITGGFQFPLNWEAMDRKETVKRVKLNPNSGLVTIEYENVKQQFGKTLPQAQIISITRLQHINNWEIYCLTKRIMERMYGDGCANEQMLFHGTLPDKLDAITEQNLDPRLAGGRTGTLLGKGTYFAVDSQYSDSYARADDTGHKFMYLVKVLAGKVCVGKPEYIRPPPIDPKDPRSRLYDSCIDNEKKPRVYCLYRDSQYYLEHLIEYT